MADKLKIFFSIAVGILIALILTGNLRLSSSEYYAGEAVGPEDSFMGEADEFVGEEEAALVGASVSRRGALGGAPFLGQSAASGLRPGRRIRIAGNNDVSQWRGSTTRFARPSAPVPPAPAPKVPPAQTLGPKAKAAAKVLPKAAAKVAPKAVIPPQARATAKVARTVAKTTARTVAKGAAKRLGWMPEVSSNEGYTIIPR